MATKAQQFSSAIKPRNAKRKAPKTSRGGARRGKTANTEMPGVGSDQRRWGGASTAARNESKHAARKAVYELEDTRASSARPSRKSTRGASKNHIKSDSSLHAKVVAKTMSPTRRSQMKKTMG